MHLDFLGDSAFGQHGPINYPSIKDPLLIDLHDDQLVKVPTSFDINYWVNFPRTDGFHFDEVIANFAIGTLSISLQMGNHSKSRRSKEFPQFADERAYIFTFVTHAFHDR